MKNTATILMDEYLELLNFKKSVLETELIVEYVNSYYPSEKKAYLFLNTENYKEELDVMFNDIKIANRNFMSEIEDLKSENEIIKMDIDRLEDDNVKLLSTLTDLKNRNIIQRIINK